MEAVRTEMRGRSARDQRRNVLNLLAERGALDTAEKQRVASIIDESEEPLDQILSKLGLVTEEKLALHYAEIFSLPRFEMLSTDGCPADKGLNRRFLYARRIAPLRIDRDHALAMIVDPADSIAIEGLGFALERPVTLAVATATEFESYFSQRFPETGDVDEASVTIDASSDVSRLKDMASAEPVIRYVNRLISEASRRRASDIHIAPGTRRADVRFRVDGRLEDYETIAEAQALSAISRFKILADLDIAEQRRPQDGRMSFPVAGRSIDLRLSTNPTVNGESLVVRLLDQSSAPLDLGALGFSEGTAKALKSWIGEPHGIVLLTGPTGSGKTTTLYTLLTMLTTGERKILTIEDPVEYRLPGINQTQVNPAIGLGFAEALRSFLRHDPDVIMVGEMRDAETARIAMRAALTGHLVLSTLHTNDAPSAITRLLDMGVEDYLVASTLLGVVGQRLVRKLCNECRGAAEARKHCGQCSGAGYQGRTVISEAITVDEAVRGAIKAGARSADIERAGEAQSFRGMAEDGAAKVQGAVTTAEEVRRAIG